MKRPAKSYKAYPAAGFLVLLVLGFARQAFADTKPKFLYVAKNESSTPSTVSGYAIDSTTGALSPVPGSPFAAGVNPVSMAVTPSNKFVYAANNGSKNISAYTVNGTTGALTPVSGSPFATGAFPQALVIDPSGKYVYVASQTDNNISAYTIDATTGALNSVPGSPFATSTNEFSPGSTPWAEAIDPSGKFLYVGAVSGYIVAYTIDLNTGALTMVTGSPFAAGPHPVYSSDFRSVAVDPSGKFLYAVDLGFDNMLVYMVNGTTGALTEVSGSPFAVGPHPFTVTIDPLGRFVYVTDPHEGNVWGYTTDGTTGALTPIAGSPFASPTVPFTVAVDPSGKFAYVADQGSTDDGHVTAFAIDGTNGTLAPIPGSPFAAGTEPYALAITNAATTVPFEIFKAKADIDEDRKTSFRVEGFFTLGKTSDGIDPVNEAVQLRVGTFSTTIPAGSFWKEGRQEFEYEGRINDVELRITIHHVEGRRDEWGDHEGKHDEEKRGEGKDHEADHDKEKHKDTKDFLFTAQGRGHILSGVVN